MLSWCAQSFISLPLTSLNRRQQSLLVKMILCLSWPNFPFVNNFLVVGELPPIDSTLHEGIWGAMSTQFNANGKKLFHMQWYQKTQHNILSILSFISLVNNSLSKPAYQVPNSPTSGSNHRTHTSTWIYEHFLPDSSDQPQLLSYLLNA